MVVLTMGRANKRRRYWVNWRVYSLDKRGSFFFGSFIINPLLKKLILFYDIPSPITNQEQSMAEKKAVFIGATGQHVGKTTISLGLNALLRKRFNNVGFIKPVGQEHVLVHETPVDKDVYLFRKLFSMESDW